MASDQERSIALEVDGVILSCYPEGTLLDALRDDPRFQSVKDGCSPQGQCGCCTVLVDGLPRVSCVTPVRRVEGRSITTFDGLDHELRERFLAAFDATAASQCGFCTPGILVRLAGLARKGVPSEMQVRTALGAHLCRCTGFQPIVEAALTALDPSAPLGSPRDEAKATARATLESGTSQRAGQATTAGVPGFAIDTAPTDSMVGIGSADGGYVVASSEREARAQFTKIQGRNSTHPLRTPLALPDVDGAVVRLQTTFVEPAYLEPDTSWCEPGGEPASPFANAGAFGAKRNSPIREDARQRAEEEQRPVLLTWPREEVVRRGAKRPPLALALRSDGSGVVRIGRTPGSDEYSDFVESLRLQFPLIEFEIETIVGPRCGITHRGAVVAEVLAALAVVSAEPGKALSVSSANGASARVAMSDGMVSVHVSAGDPLCTSTLRSYAIGAVHQGLSMVLSEGIALDENGEVLDLTIRSFGILSAAQMPPVDVTLEKNESEPVACGVVVMAAAMAACWLDAGLGSYWPVNREVRQ
jgi:hypothetical protein